MCLCHPARPTRPAPTLGRRPLLGALAVGLGAGATGGCLSGGQLNALGEAAAPVLVPPETARRLGDEAWATLLAQTPSTTGGAKAGRVQRVADRLLRASGQNPAAWDVRVFQGTEANAFALPGGHIGVYEGMLAVAATDAQLATVMGHEIAHNLENHAAERVATQGLASEAIRLAGSAVAGPDAATQQLIYGVLGLGAQFGVFLPYSRTQELEADRLGLTLMAEGGYDPRASIEFWQRMQAAAGPRPPEFASTHPGPANRLAQLQQYMPQALARYRPV